MVWNEMMATCRGDDGERAATSPACEVRTSRPHLGFDLTQTQHILYIHTCTGSTVHVQNSRFVLKRTEKVGVKHGGGSILLNPPLPVDGQSAGGTHAPTTFGS